MKKEFKIEKCWESHEDRLLLRLHEKHGKDWELLASKLSDRSPESVRERFMSNSKTTKMTLWEKYEDAMLIKLHARYGDNWEEIASALPGRSKKSARDRWVYHLNPAVNNGKWEPEEDAELRRLYDLHGRRWTEIANALPGRTHIAVRNRWNIIDPDKKNGEWDEYEDETLRRMHRKYGNNWSLIAEEIPGRSSKKIQERWTRALNPSLKEGIWMLEEDEKLIKLHGEHGNKWSLIAQELPGRSAYSVRQRFFGTLSMNWRMTQWEKHEDDCITALVAEHGKQWNLIAEELPYRSPSSIRMRWTYLESKKKKVKNALQRKWIEDEDRILLWLHKRYGPKWKRISSEMPGRNSTEVESRFKVLCARQKLFESKKYRLTVRFQGQNIRITPISNVKLDLILTKLLDGLNITSRNYKFVLNGEVLDHSKNLNYYDCPTTLDLAASELKLSELSNRKRKNSTSLEKSHIKKPKTECPASSL